MAKRNKTSFTVCDFNHKRIQFLKTKLVNANWQEKEDIYLEIEELEAILHENGFSVETYSDHIDERRGRYNLRD